MGTLTLCAFSRLRFSIGLLATLMTVPAWATLQSPDRLPGTTSQGNFDRVFDALSSSSPTMLQDSYAELLRNIEAFPDVAVFPILVAGPVFADTTSNLAHKLAQASGAGNIAVIYPDISEPYRSVFTQIIGGIEGKAKGRVTNFAVGPNVDVGELSNSLRRQNTRVVIALGRQGVKATSGLDSNIGVVVGGVLTASEHEVHDHQVNSLSPDPALLFSRLKSLKPGVRRVFAVYDPRQNAWMMRLAKEAARTHGLEFVAFESQDLRSAMLAYQKILATADSAQDALWLPQDSTTVEDGSVLPLVLQESWARNLAVFSSSFGHVRRGVLFSLYPNNIELGRHLAGSALGFLASGTNEASGMLPLREVLMAINLRTARHLEINTSRQQSFDMAFPEQ
ncbi:MAG: ABC transporter substrate binding protein [Gallionella sp.]|jgi:putative ABC transport system substrate-binding protein